MGTMNRKLRGFVIDEGTGVPLADVPLGVIAIGTGATHPDSSATVERTLGIFQSDHTGFFSIPLESSTRVESLAVYPLADPSHRIDVAPYLTVQEPTWAVPIPLSPKHHPGRHIGKAYPSIVLPDTFDWMLSPRSFATMEPLRIGGEGCEELVISRAVLHTFRFSQIVREPGDAPKVLSPAHNIQPLCEDRRRLPQATCWRRGAVLLYETTWAPMGHALGEIAYSLALAPCEQINLAVIEWSRHDQTVRGEDTSLAEQLQHNLRRDRSIEETVDAVLTESQKGSSVAGGLGANIGVANLSLSGSYAGTSGTRKVASDAVQEISDRIVQASTLAQRFNSTVIVQASQAERDAVQTRVVANHNHCHALTVLYYQVLRHFLVTTRLADKQDVILIKREVNEFKKHDEVLRYRTVFERALLEPSLRRCFDALEKEFCAQVRLDKRGFVEEPQDHELREMRAKIRTGEHGLDDSIFLDSDVYVLEIKLSVKSGAPVPLIVLDELHRRGYAAGLPNSHITGRRNLQIPESTVLAAQQEDIFTLRPSRRVDWGEVTAIEVSYIKPSFASARSYDLVSLRLETSTQGDRWVLYDDATPINVTLTAGTPPLQPPATIKLEPVGPFGPQQPADVLTDPELCCVERLMQHLQDNALHYSRAIWLAEDRDVRAEWLDLYGFELDGQSGRLLDFVRNEIVGVVGDYLALPLASQEFADTLDVPRPEQRIVSLPTRGLFAEAKLGSCNACEELDVTRFWDWTESPCPELAPAIEGVHPGSRAQAMTAAPTVTQPTLGIEAPPSAPEPASIAGVLEALGKSDVFKDMSGKEGSAGIVEELVKGAIDLEKEKIKQKAAASAPSGAAPSAGAPAAAPVPGSATTKPPSAGREMHDKLKAIEGAEKRDDISPEAAKSASEAVVLAAANGVTVKSEEYVIPWDGKLTYADSPVSPQARWAGAVAEMLSWRDAQTLEGKPYTVQQAMQLLDTTRPNDPIFESKWQNGLPIVVLPATSGQPAVDDLSELLQATKTNPSARKLRRGVDTFNAASQSFNLPDPVQIRKLLMQYGPLWLTAIGANVEHEGQNINGQLRGGFILSAIVGDGTVEGSKLQVLSNFKDVAIMTFKSFLGHVANISSMTARDGEVFFLHFE
jgi:hypothetical protein